MHELPKNLFSLEAEQEVIGAILSSPDALDDALEVIQLSDLYNVQHRRIIEQAIALRESGKPFDGVSVMIALESSDHPEDGAFAIEAAANSSGASNVKSYARVVYERAKLRNLRQALQEANDYLAEADAAADALDFAQARLVELDSRSFNAEIQEANPVLKRVIQNIDERFRNRGAGIIGGLSTGLDCLDERYNGLRDGHLIVLAARPSMGKSALAMQIVQNVSLIEKKTSLVFSLEMPTDELFERMMATQGNLEYSRIRNGSMEEGDWPKLSSAVQKLKGAPILTVDTPAIHINQIRAYARKAHRRSPLGVVVVDHINITAADGQSREREISMITGGLKALAKELSCPVIALSQLNRKCEERSDKRPMMSDLRDSGTIEQDADIVAFMYRDDYYHPDSPRKGIVEILTRKFRGGEVGDDYVANRLNVMRLENLTHDVPPPEPARQSRKTFSV